MAVQALEAGLTGHRYRDLQDYNDTLTKNVTNDLYEASSNVTGEHKPYWDAMDAVNRTRKIAQQKARQLDAIVNNSTVVPVRSILNQTFAEVTETVRDASGIVPVDPDAAVDDPLGLVQRLDDPSLVPDHRELLSEADPLPSLQNSTIDRVQQATNDPQGLAEDLVKKSKSNLTRLGNETTEVPVSKPAELTGQPIEDPRERLRTEGVVPDATFALLQSTTSGPVWDTYLQARDEASEGEVLYDMTHYKLFGLHASGEANVTRNIKLGTSYAWNIDEDDTTGASTSCDASSFLSDCEISYDTGDDLLVTVSAEGGYDGSGGKSPLHPEVTFEKIVPDQKLPWLVSAFVLAYEYDDTKDTLTEEVEPGVVGYVGMDGRTQQTSSFNESTLQMNRSYGIDDLPRNATVRLEDYGLLVDGNPHPVTEGLVDPANHVTVNASFRQIASERFDAELVAGIADYKTDDEKGKRIYAKGNTTNVTVLFRGLPDHVTLEYQEKNGSDQASGDEFEQIDLDWDVARSSQTTDDGIEATVARSANYEGVRPKVTTRIITSSLPSGAYHKNTTYLPTTDGEDDREEIHNYTADETVSEAYLRSDRWNDLETTGTPSSGTRLHLKSVPERIDVRTNTRTDVHRLEASNASGMIDLVNGPNDGSCVALGGAATNYLFFRAPDAATGRGGCLSTRVYGLESLDSRLNDPDTSGSQVEVNYTRDRGLANETRPSGTPENATLWLDDETWFTLQASDLPGTFDIDVGKDSGAVGTSVDLDYNFTPANKDIQELDLRGELPQENRAEDARLTLHAEGVPNGGTARFQEGERTIDVNFSEALDLLRFTYTEDGERPDINGQHLLFRDTDEGISSGSHTAVSGDIRGFKSLHFDGSNDDEIHLSGNVSTDRSTTVYIDRPAPTGQQTRDRFNVTLSNLPGAFDLHARSPNEDNLSLDGDVEPGIQSADIQGMLADRNWDVTLEQLGDFQVDYSHENEATGPATEDTTILLSAQNSKPLSIEGRIVDLAATSNPADSYPAPPSWAENHFIETEDADGARTLSFNLTDFEEGSLEFRQTGDGDGDGEFHFDGNYTLSGGARAFHFRSLEARDVDPNKVAYLNLSDLPEQIEITADQDNDAHDRTEGHLLYKASSEIQSADFEFRDPDRAVTATGRISGLPDRLKTTWSDSMGSWNEIEASHQGASAITSLGFELEDTTPGDERYVFLDADTVPASLTLDVSSTENVYDLRARDSAGNPTSLGAVEARYNATGLAPDLRCPSSGGSSCSGYDLLTGDFRTGETTWFVARVHGLEHLDASITGTNEGPGEIAYAKDEARPMSLFLETDDARLQGLLEPLPERGDVGYEIRRGQDDRLQLLDVGWNGSQPLDTGEFDLDLRKSSNRSLHAELSAFHNTSFRFEDGDLRLESPDGTGDLDLQYGPSSSITQKYFKEPTVTDSHYVFWDNQTVEGEDLVWLRTFDLTNTEILPSQGRLTLNTTAGAANRPLETHIERGILDGHVTASNLPADLGLTWDTDTSAQHGGFDYRASGEIEQIDADLTRRQNHSAEQGTPVRMVHQLVGTLSGIPTEVHADWARADYNITTSGTGAIGLFDLRFQNLTGDHGNATPYTFDDDVQGVAAIDQPRDDLVGSNMQFDPELREVVARLEGVRTADVDWSPTDFTATVTRADQLASPAQGLLMSANRTMFAEVTMDQLPADVVPATGTFTNVTDPSTGTTTQRANLDLTTSDPMGDGRLVFRQTEESTARNPELSRSANLTWADLPAEISLDYRTQNDTDDEGHQYMHYQGSGTGASVAGNITDGGDRYNLNISDLPRTVEANVSLDRRAGNVTTTGGDIGRIDFVVKPDDDGPYDTLAADDEGIVTKATANTEVTHVQFDNLEEAAWNLAEHGLTSGPSSVEIEHSEQGEKPVRLVLLDDVESLDNTETRHLTADLADLPNDWSVSLDGTEHQVDMSYSATESIPSLNVSWGQGPEFIQGTIEGLGSEETTLGLDFQDGYTVDFDAENPPDLVNLSTIKGEDYASLRLADVPQRIDANLAGDFRAGNIEASRIGGEEAEIGIVDASHVECTNTDEQGRCTSSPGRTTRSGYKTANNATEDAFLVHKDGGGGSSRTFAYFEGLESTRWSLRNGSTTDWLSLGLERNGSLTAPAVNVSIFGTEDEPNTRFQTVVDALPETTELYAHFPNASREPTAQAPLPEGFSLPSGVAVDNADMHVETDYGPANATLDPSIVFRSPSDDFVLDQVASDTGIPPGFIHLNGTVQGEAVDGYEGWTSFEEEIEKVHVVNIHDASETDEGGDTSRYLDLTMEAFPQRAEFFFWKDTGECPEATCKGGVKALGGDQLGNVSLWANVGSPFPRKVLPSIPDIDPNNASAPSPEYVHFHSGRHAFTGDPQPGNMQVAVNVSGLDQAMLTTEARTITADATVPEPKDLDVYVTRPDDTNTAPGNYQHFVGRLQNLAGDLDFNWTEDEAEDRFGINASLTSTDGSSVPFDAYLQGTIPISFLGHNATDYNFEAKDVHNDLHVDYEHDAQSRLKELAIDTGDVGSFKGQLHLESEADTVTQEECQEVLGSEPGTFSLRLNDQDDDMAPDIDAGTIGTLQLNAFTPDGNRNSSLQNEISMMQSCGYGTEEFGLHVSLDQLEMANLEAETVEGSRGCKGGESVTDAKTVFSKGYTPSFEFRSLCNDRVTRAWSEAWPSTARVHVVSGGWLKAMNTWIRGEGVGDICAVQTYVYLEYDCWRFHAFVPYAGETAKVDMYPREGERASVWLDEIGEGLLSVGINSAKSGASEVKVEVADGARDIYAAVRSVGQGLSDIQLDLDGVSQRPWSGQVPFFLDANGAVEGEFSSDGYAAEWEAMDEGAFDSASVWLGSEPKDTDDDGDTDYREQYIKRGGSHTHEDPFVWLKSNGWRFKAPSCMWESDPCEA